MALEVTRLEAAGLSPSLLLDTRNVSETGTALLACLQRRQG